MNDFFRFFSVFFVMQSLNFCYISFTVMSGCGQLMSQKERLVQFQWKVCVNRYTRICALQAPNGHNI